MCDIEWIIYGLKSDKLSHAIGLERGLIDTFRCQKNSKCHTLYRLELTLNYTIALKDFPQQKRRKTNLSEEHATRDMLGLSHLLLLQSLFYL